MKNLVEKYKYKLIRIYICRRCNNSVNKLLVQHAKEILKQILSRYENNTFKLLRKEMYNDFVNKTEGEKYSLTRTSFAGSSYIQALLLNLT